jgi:molybdopterin-binding protein
MIRVRDAADLLGVSDDTVRRWIDDGALPVDRDQAGRKVVPGQALAEFAAANTGAAPKEPLGIASSARNRFTGLVTKVVIDGVMAHVEMKCGPFTVVSLMSADAARELKLEPGSVAVAVVKATTVIVESPEDSREMCSASCDSRRCSRPRDGRLRVVE